MKHPSKLFRIQSQSCDFSVATRNITKSLSSRRWGNLASGLKALACALCILLSHSISYAQSDFEITALNPNLEEEYQAELDKWMLRAYEGDRDAQFKVGVLFTNDQFNKPDFEQAVYWYKQAARQGHVLAQYNLGHQYLTGVGVAKNQTTAMEWWMKAAKQDHALAQFNVGRAYYLGIGLPEDYAKSRSWFERAAGNNEPKSIDILKQLGWTDANDQLLAANRKTSGGSEAEIESETESNEQLTSVITAVDLSDLDGTDQQTAAPDEAQNPSESVAAIDSEKGAIEEDLAADSSQEAEIVADVTATETAKETTEPQSQNDALVDNTIKSPIALYTNPEIRSVLIALIDDRSDISIKSESGPWSIVSSNIGFPVWVHSDFIKVDENIGTITGENVNARSVPIVTNGTVVGKLNKSETLQVVDQRDNWFRVVAPRRFQAWVKTSDIERQEVITGQDIDAEPKVIAKTASQPAAELTGPRPTNDNDWLFSQSPNTYTLQLASFDDPEKVAEFESRAKFITNPELHRFTASGKGIEWTYYLYGAYQDNDTAQVAKLDINQKRAWIRNFGKLQQNRCVAWKTQFPTPKELNNYCVGQ